MHCANNMVIMQTKQLGQIETLEEKLLALEGWNQALEQKLEEQDRVITNLMGDNLKHLQNNMHLTAHINGLSEQMAQLETQLGWVGSVLMGMIKGVIEREGLSSSGAGTSDASCHRYDFLVCLFRTDLLFSNFLCSFGIDHDPPCSLCSHDLCLFPFLMFHFSHEHMTKRSHYCIMIFSDFGVLLIYGRTPTLIFFYLLHNSTTPILPVYVDQRRPYLEKDTTRSRSMIVQKSLTVPRRTLLTPD